MTQKKSELLGSLRWEQRSMLSAQIDQRVEALLAVGQGKAAQVRGLLKGVGRGTRGDHQREQVAAILNFRESPVDAKPEAMDRCGPDRSRVQESIVARHTERIKRRAV